MSGPQAVELFDANYYATGCGRPYQRDEFWLQFFGGIAERIINDIGPVTVLDAGCALGFLVEGLRTRGIEAFGMDISEYAIEHVHPSVRPYCQVGSITEPFSRKYDLIVSIEVLEHMPLADAQRAIANFCAHSDDILFSSTPFDFREVTHFNVQNPEVWAEEFARHGFVRDVDFDASFITQWAARFRRTREPQHQVLRDYERRFWVLWKETLDLRALSLDLRNEVARAQQAVAAQEVLKKQVEEAQQALAQQGQALRETGARLAEQEERAQTLQDQLRVWEGLEQTMGWRLLRGLQTTRSRLAPPASSRDQILEALWQGARARDGKTRRMALQRIGHEISQQVSALPRRILRRDASRAANAGGQFDVTPVIVRPDLAAHTASADIIICVHNAFDDVQRCLTALLAETGQPYNLILVDDGSDAETQSYLAAFAQAHAAMLLRNELARGYTRAANLGLQRSTADYAVLLNSDTIVTSGWLDRMIACAESADRIGLVGPLSNAATWQSIPEVESAGDWANNPLPDGVSVAEQGERVARYSARIYPALPFLNGFCLLVRRAVIAQIGYFDEEKFGAGYGEENDYCLRARAAGWSLALADDAYVYHTGARSYTDERRRALVQRADATLVRTHGSRIVRTGSDACRTDRVLEGIRAHSRVLAEQRAYIEKGRAEFAGRRVLFLLPILTAGGGGNVVVFKAHLMREMGVQAAIFNRQEFREPFERAYPALDVSVVYGDPLDVPRVAAEYDAVVATANVTASWLAPTVEPLPNLIRGYFIQDFEPYFYPMGSDLFKAAWASYSLIPDMVRFATTKWIQREVTENTRVACGLVGPCFDLNLFRPRPRSEPEWPARPLRIAAMIRPETPYRAPRFTIEVLRSVARRYGKKVEVVLFGTAANNPDFLALPLGFPWRLAGMLGPSHMASLLNRVDIFVDFSAYQALGITAQEAMACGVATVVPQRGGTDEYARHEENCLVVDTGSPAACEAALSRLVEDHALRAHLQHNAIFDVCAYFPEKPAYKILAALFGDGQA